MVRHHDADSRRARAERARLGAVVRAYLRAGWPMAAGAWWVPEERRHRCGRPGCRLVEAHPVDFEAAPGESCAAPPAASPLTGTAEVERRWSRHPYAPVLVTGLVVDVLDGPSVALGPVVRHLRAAGAPLPIAVPARGRLRLVVATTGPLGEVAEPMAAAGVRHHGAGGWAALPPAGPEGQPVHWIRPPQEIRWAVPPVGATLAALRAVFSPPSTPGRRDGRSDSTDPPRSRPPAGS